MSTLSVQAVRVSRFSSSATIEGVTIQNVLRSLRQIPRTIQEFEGSLRNEDDLKRRVETDCKVLLAAKHIIESKDAGGGIRSHRAEIARLFRQIETEILRLSAHASTFSNQKLISFHKLAHAFQDLLSGPTNAYKTVVMQGFSQESYTKVDAIFQERKKLLSSQEYCASLLEALQKKHAFKPPSVAHTAYSLHVTFSSEQVTTHSLIEMTKKDGHRPEPVKEKQKDFPAISFHPFVIPQVGDPGYKGAVTQMAHALEQASIRSFLGISNNEILDWCIKGRESVGLQGLNVFAQKLTNYLFLQIIGVSADPNERLSRAEFFFDVMQEAYKNRDFATTRALFCALQHPALERVFSQGEGAYSLETWRGFFAELEPLFGTGAKQEVALRQAQKHSCVPTVYPYFKDMESLKSTTVFKSDLIPLAFQVVQHMTYLQYRSALANETVGERFALFDAVNASVNPKEGQSPQTVQQSMQVLEGCLTPSSNRRVPYSNSRLDAWETPLSPLTPKSFVFDEWSQSGRPDSSI